MVPETVYTNDVFFCSVFYMLKAMKVWSESLFRGLITKTEFKNPSSTSTSHLATVMKWKQTCVLRNFFLLFIFFLLKIPYLLWNIFVTQNVIISLFYPPTHLKRHWRFAWQNRCGRSPLKNLFFNYNLPREVTSYVKFDVKFFGRC